MRLTWVASLAVKAPSPQPTSRISSVDVRAVKHNVHSRGEGRRTCRLRVKPFLNSVRQNSHEGRDGLAIAFGRPDVPRLRVGVFLRHVVCEPGRCLSYVPT
jgi:hypothetical protein